jgi:hypothetical protein
VTLERVPISLERLHSPLAVQAPMVGLHLTQDGEQLHVRLAFALDPRVRAHGKLIQRGLGRAGSIFDLEYSVRLKLDDEWENVSRTITRLWSTPAGQALRRPELARLSKVDHQLFVAPLAAHGWYLFSALFRRIASEHHSRNEAALIQRAVDSLWREPQRIEIKSHVPLFPWALLYQRPYSEVTGGKLDAADFWGETHELQQMPRGIAGKYLLPVRPSIVAAICPSTDAGTRHACDGHPLAGSSVTRTCNIPELVSALRRFDGDCLYFYGHAEQLHPPSKFSSKVLLDRVALSVAELEEQRAPRFTKSLVLAFLNGCGTAPIRAWSEDSIAGYLCLHGDGRVVCIATVAQIPDAFAARFAFHFWRAFLLPVPVGRALLDARRAMLSEANNPLGLLYTYFGLIDLKLGEQPV